MDRQARNSERLVPLLIAALVACILYSLPSTVLYYLLLWTLASVPIGILMGHCVLRDHLPKPASCHE